MKKMVVAILFILIICSFAGCGKLVYPNLPEQAIAFETDYYVNEDGGISHSYQSFEYNGRTYVLYGKLVKKLHSNDISECLGYLVNDYDVSDKEARVFSLIEDPENNYLMRHDLYGGTYFYRALDTKGMYIKTPDYIGGSEEYEIWE